jgi:polyhydroxyalkanoate synthase
MESTVPKAREVYSEDHAGDDGAIAALYQGASEWDSAVRALASPLTKGVSPYASMQAWIDWTFHLAFAPGRVGAQVADLMMKARTVASYAANPDPARAAEPPFTPEPGDRRFRNDAWRAAPFDALVQGQLAAEAWWRDASAPLRGVRDHHTRRIAFAGRQLLNALAPANFPWSNPLVWDAFMRTGGQNFIDGARILRDDTTRLAQGKRFAELDQWKVGETLAITPGDVVFRNELMELIQYRPATPKVHAAPVLLTPAWIMKYYILDLTPRDSLVRYLVDQGFTVFCISWRNPDESMRDVSFEDYRIDGVMRAIDEVIALTSAESIHGVGYCLGGTALATAAAAMARDGDNRLATMTLLAAQTDFSEAGELMMFIGESQIAALEDVMLQQGYLDSVQMAGAFSVLRAHEMVWARIVERYLLGERRADGPLDFWLADPTRMPARMHSEYLRWLFMENRLAEGTLTVGGHPAFLKDIVAPIFAVGAERDHIAPWRSVHKIGLFTGAHTTFALTGGGHNAGIVSPPDKPGAYYWLHDIGACNDYEDPEEWLSRTPRHEGSWWPAWTQWLMAHTAGRMREPPIPAHSLGPAPGTYVHVS